MYYKLINNQKFLWFLLFVVAIIFSIPSFEGGFVLAHDMFFHTMRVEAIKQGLESGIFPVKLYGVFFNDYGYPSGFFYPDIFLYIPAFLRLMGFDMSFSYRSFFFLINLWTAICSFYSFNKLFQHINKDSEIESKTPYYIYGFASAVLYTGALYRFTDLYVRSALGEAIAMSFFSLAVISFYLMLKGDKKAWIFVVIGSTGILSSHLITSLLLFITYVIISLVCIKNFLSREFLKSLLKATIFVTLINVWFYAPFVDMYNSYDFYIRNDVASVKDIKILPWGDLFKYRFFVGILPIIVLLIYLIFALKRIISKTADKLDKIFLMCIIFSIVFILLIPASAPWAAMDFIPVLSKTLGALQFSYRVMMFTCIFLSVALAIAVCRDKRFFVLTLVIPFSILFWMTATPWTHENSMVSIYTEKNSTLGDLIVPLKGTKAGDMLLVSLDLMNNPHLAPITDYIHSDIKKEDFMSYPDGNDPRHWEAIKNRNLITLNPNEITPENAVTNFSREGLNLEFTTNAKESTEIKLPLWYYPHCYMATCDGKEIPVFEVYHHRLAVTTPAGEHDIKVFPKLHTPYRNACIISVIGLFAFVFLCFRELKKGL